MIRDVVSKVTIVVYFATVSRHKKTGISELFYSDFMDVSTEF
jgi:hypothetical protein